MSQKTKLNNLVQGALDLLIMKFIAKESNRST